MSTNQHIQEIDNPSTLKTFKVRRKGPLKLRFHHQALPQAYLNHYENSQSSSKSTVSLEKEKKVKKEITRTIEKLEPPSESIINNESILSWLHSILETQQPEET